MLTGELVGQRPSMTPRHSGTIWSTYQLTPALRLGVGLNARSSQAPNRNPAGIVRRAIGQAAGRPATWCSTPAPACTACSR